MLAPALAVVGLLFAGGLLFAALESLGVGGPAAQAFTLRHYARVASDPEFLQSLLLTFYVAVLSTVLSAVGAVLLSAGLWSAAQRRPAFHVLLQVPVATPHISVALAVIYLCAPSGLLSRLLNTAGWVSSPADFPAILNDRFAAGIILVYLLKETPFLTMICLVVLMRTGEGLHDLARTLGAGRWQRVVHVTIPLVLPALAAGSVAVFAYAFCAFEVPLLLGRPYPAMLGVVAQRKFMEPDLSMRPEALAFAMLTAVSSAVAVWLCYRLLARQEFKQ
jgi:putative spermidine/putrescine transport system permease protein